jgi:hypothetical protein
MVTYKVRCVGGCMFRVSVSVCAKVNVSVRVKVKVRCG